MNAIIEVPGASFTWNATKIATTLETIKAKVVEVYGTLQGSQKGIRFIDLGMPELKNGNIRFHISINMGSELFTQSEPPSPTSADVKWGKEDDIAGAPPIPCSGDANTDIATIANSQLAYFVGNLPILNKSLDISVVLSNIGAVVTSGGAAAAGIQTLFVKNTLDYSDPLATPPYIDRGQYKIHYDETNDMNQVCFNSTKIENYAARNVELGRSVDYLGRVRATNPRRSAHQLVGTFVIVQKKSLGLTSTPIVIVTREHPTAHYYAAVAFVADVTKAPPLLF